MRTIRKGKEPASLAEHRCVSDAYYSNYLDMDGLRRALVGEQRGLCCYCLSRIRPEASKMKIEHWRCQANHPSERLNYANMLGACLGNQGQPKDRQHCDTRKGNDELSRNPANPLHQVDSLIRFEGDGRIASHDPVFDDELNRVLNLNVAFLRNNRKSTLDAFHAFIGKRGELHRSTLERLVREWNGESHDGELREYCQVVVFWLRKRLARA